MFNDFINVDSYLLEHSSQTDDMKMIENSVNTVQLQEFTMHQMYEIDEERNKGVIVIKPTHFPNILTKILTQLSEFEIEID